MWSAVTVLPLRVYPGGARTAALPGGAGKKRGPCAYGVYKKQGICQTAIGACRVRYTAAVSATKMGLVEGCRGESGGYTMSLRAAGASVKTAGNVPSTSPSAWISTRSLEEASTRVARKLLTLGWVIWLPS